MLSVSGNLFKCHEEILNLQPLIPPTKRFDIFPPIITGGCSEGLGMFWFFFKLPNQAASNVPIEKPETLRVWSCRMTWVDECDSS